MTKVDLAEQEIDNLKAEIKKWKNIKENIEGEISCYEYHIGELEDSQRNAWTEIENKKNELNQLKVKLKKIKAESEPLDGQLAFVSTGYKEAVLM